MRLLHESVVGSSMERTPVWLVIILTAGGRETDAVRNEDESLDNS
jgi:hypothetical protein